MPVLYLVATPIGNLEDVSLRALRILGEVGVIAAEDTRVTRKLLTRHGIKNRLVSYHQFSGPERVQRLIETLAGQDVALVSDAGMPNISDPGYALVKAAIQHGIQVTPIPGPSALISAVAVSGLPTDQFVYLGFVPRKPGDRRRLLGALTEERRTAVFFESPHRLHRTLDDLIAVVPERPLAVCRELTKLYEEVFRGDPAGARAHFAQPRGEFTLVVGGRPLVASAYWERSEEGAAARG